MANCSMTRWSFGWKLCGNSKFDEAELEKLGGPSMENLGDILRYTTINWMEHGAYARTFYGIWWSTNLSGMNVYGFWPTQWLSKYFACSIARSTADQVQLLPETTEMLRGFYTPYVKDLQEGLKWLVLLFH